MEVKNDDNQLQSNIITQNLSFENEEVSCSRDEVLCEASDLGNNESQQKQNSQDKSDNWIF